jgi:hypothetical protein
VLILKDAISSPFYLVYSLVDININFNFFSALLVHLFRRGTAPPVLHLPMMGVDFFQNSLSLSVFHEIEILLALAPVAFGPQTSKKITGETHGFKDISIATYKTINKDTKI